ncbi:MAG: hypothetical protein FWC60_05350 [Firmicutes bacterium]|nr:hypothetical protein [Bacillota bacterium]
MPKKKRAPRVYKIINIHPTYETEEDRKKAHNKAALIAIEVMRRDQEIQQNAPNAVS